MLRTGKVSTGAMTMLARLTVAVIMSIILAIIYYLLDRNQE